MISPILEREHKLALKNATYQEGLVYLDGWPRSYPDVISVDTETTGLNPRRDRIVGISMSGRAGEAYAFETQDDLPGRRVRQTALQIPKIIRDVIEKESSMSLAEPDSVLIAHNFAYDGPVLRQVGWTRDCDFDTMIAAYVLNKHRQGLKWLSKDEFDVDMQGIDDLILSGKITMADVPWELVVPYACADADQTLQLFDLYSIELAMEPKLQRVFDLEMAILPMLIRMSDVGVKVDANYLAPLEVDVTEAREEKLTEIKQHAQDITFNPDSPAQLSRLLFEKLGIEPIKSTDTPGQFATGKDILQELMGEHPIIDAILEYRSLRVLVNTFIGKLPRILDPISGRIHPNWRQTTVVTGRLSCQPNLQNIPIRGAIGDKIRKAFVPEDGFTLVGADYKAMEVRVLAHLSGDPTLCQVITEGKDPHLLTAAEAFAMKPEDVPDYLRDCGKTTFFAVGYGAQEWKVSQIFRPVISHQDATELCIKRGKKPGKDSYVTLARIVIASIYRVYPQLLTWKEENIRVCAARGYAETMFGRRGYVQNLNSSSSKARAADERFVGNMPVQGTASGDIMKEAMKEIWYEFRQYDWFRPILQVHDELQLEVPIERAVQVQATLEAIMPYVVKLNVPLAVDTKIGKSWAETH